DRLLAKRPEDRYQTATEVAQILGQRLARVQDPGCQPPPVSPTSRARGAGATGTARRRWVMAAGALTIVLAGLGATEASGVTHLVTTVLRITTPDGTLIVEVDDPGVHVTIEGDGGLIFTGTGAQTVRLRPGSYRVQADKAGRPVAVEKELVTI